MRILVCMVAVVRRAQPSCVCVCVCASRTRMIRGSDCAGGSLLDKFNAVRERACKEHSKDTGMPDAFVRACMQAVLDAVEHIHVEVGVAHTNVKMESGVHVVACFLHTRVSSSLHPPR